LEIEFIELFIHLAELEVLKYLPVYPTGIERVRAEDEKGRLEKVSAGERGILQDISVD